VSPLRWLVLALALAAGSLALWRLEAMRTGLSAAALPVAGGTPATVWRRPGAGPAPVVVIAHGFAGSRQLMEGFALTLARAGYIAVAFDFAGHGRNRTPMTGDVTRIEGTTRVLMDEVGRVTDAALALPGADGRVALVGHSMASDIVVRRALEDERVVAVVAVSMFSQAVSGTRPRNLLMIAGGWERFLSAEALAALRLADPAAGFGQTVGDFAAGTARRAVRAPGVEHVGVLYSATTLAETRAWLDAAFGRATDGQGGAVPRRGGWIALLLGAVVAAAWPLAGFAGRWRARRPPERLPAGAFAAVVAAAAILTPLVLWPLPTRFLPVLVADYLAVHFLLYGAIALAGLLLTGGLWLDEIGEALPALALALPVAAYGILGFGSAIDAYVAAFWPTPERAVTILAIAAGAVPFMLADAILTEGGRAPLWRVAAVRGAALASLGVAVALDLERLFFLLIILPVILVFFLVFGMIGGWVGRATWRPAAGGIGLGLFLAWALGVTFPMVAA
jgi:hypothetical protein